MLRGNGTVLDGTVALTGGRVIKYAYKSSTSLSWSPVYALNGKAAKR
jgi:hypothetical protein